MKTKSFYILGIFLTLFISASILWMLKNDVFKQKATYIEYRDKELEQRLGYNLDEYLKTKSIFLLQLNGNEKYDDSILKQFQLKIQEIQKAQNPNIAIHLKFDKKTTYGNVVRSFQICKIEDCTTYAPDGYDFWVFPYTK